MKTVTAQVETTLRERSRIFSAEPTFPNFLIMIDIAEDFDDLERIQERLVKASALYYSGDGEKIRARMAERRGELQEAMFTRQLERVSTGSTVVEVEVNLSQALAQLIGMELPKQRIEEIKRAAFQRQVELLDTVR